MLALSMRSVGSESERSQEDSEGGGQEVALEQVQGEGTNDCISGRGWRMAAVMG